MTEEEAYNRAKALSEGMAKARPLRSGHPIAAILLTEELAAGASGARPSIRRHLSAAVSELHHAYARAILAETRAGGRR